MAERYGGVRRSELEDSDFVFPEERAFPVMTSKDVKDAVSSWGRYRGDETFETFKKRLTALAKRKDMEDALPAEWKQETKSESFDPFAEESAIKVGRRHRKDDMATMKAMYQHTKMYYTKMGEYMKALGVDGDDDNDGMDGEDSNAELFEQREEAPSEMKALTLDTLSKMVCNAVCEALEDLDLIDEDDEDEDVAMMAQMAQPVMAAYRKGGRYEDDVDYPEVYVYMDYAIACLGDGEDWKIPYRMEGGDVVLDTPDAWERVGMEWEPIPGAARLDAEGNEVKMLDDGTIIAQAVRFGSPDEHDMSAYKDFFTKSTDFWLERWDRRPMLYHHAMDEGTRDAPVIGMWIKAWTDDAGVWLQGQLDKAHKYHSAIKELARRGLLRVSTDSAPHLVQREALANGVNYVKTWPIMAASLTVSPAEPRLIPAELKTLLSELGIDIAADADATFGADRPQAKGDDGRARRIAADLELLALEA